MLCDLRIHVGPPVGFDESPSWTRHLVLLLLVGGGGGGGPSKNVGFGGQRREFWTDRAGVGFVSMFAWRPSTAGLGSYGLIGNPTK
jgi:hypothetical protein